MKRVAVRIGNEDIFPRKLNSQSSHQGSSQGDHVRPLLLGEEVCSRKAGACELASRKQRNACPSLTVEVEDTRMEPDLLKPVEQRGVR